MITLQTIGDTIIRYEASVPSLIFCCGMNIDADGSPHAYAPEGSCLIGLDYLANAGSPGNWWGIATDANGVPYIQGPDDAAPGYYVSTTALENTQFAISDPRRYVNSEIVPFIVLPRGLMKAPKLGAQVHVLNLHNGKAADAIYADIGPANSIGEGAIALANALGVNSDAKSGGIQDGILYTVFL